MLFLPETIIFTNVLRGCLFEELSRIIFKPIIILNLKVLFISIKHLKKDEKNIMITFFF